MLMAGLVCATVSAMPPTFKDRPSLLRESRAR